MVGKVTRDDQASASMLPAIMGISKYASPNDALRNALNAIDGRPRDDISNESMHWGNTFEPAILKEASMRLGLDNLDISHDQAYQHQRLPLAASLDGTAFGRGLRIENDPDKGIFVMGQDSIVLEGVGIMEAKLTAMDVEDAPPLWRGPVQVQACMDILGCKWGAVCTLYRGTRLHIYLFAPHEQTMKAIEWAVLDFDRRLTKYREHGEIEYYAPKDSADANRTWAQADEDKADPLGLGGEADELCAKIERCQSQIKELEQLIDGYQADLKEMMKDYPRAVTDNYEIKWPMRHYKATAERVVPAKPAHSVRQSTLTVKERKWIG